MRVRASEAEIDRPTPAQKDALGDFTALLYSDTGGLTQFGAFTETLQPGAKSSHRHWHEKEDEFLYMLKGEATLIDDDGEHVLAPGDACCWKAGVANGHHITNTSDQPCTYLIVGSRLATDTVHYSDIDKILIRENGERRLTRRDGTPFDPNTGDNQ